MTWFTKFGRCLYTSPSGYKVYDNYFYRWLTLESSILQTVIDKKKPMKPMLYYLPALTLIARSQPDNCCLLGLGGAAAAQLLSSYPVSITAVENSEEIITIAQNYFMLDKLINLKVVHQSAELYLEQDRSLFGHLLVDLYNAQSFPPECNNEYFFVQCKNRLKADGFLAINLANPNDQYTILQLIKMHFINTLVIPVKKCANMVIIASNHPDKDRFLESLLSSKEIKKILLVNSWGHVSEMKR